MDPEVGQQEPLLPTEGASTSEDASQEHWTRIAARQCYTSCTNLGTACFFGLITAVALKTIGQTVAMALVLLFIGLQVLAYYGFVNFNWSTVGSVVVRRLDLGRDGKLGLSDVASMCKRAGSWALSWGVPTVLGYSGGFWVGWKVL